MGRPMPNSDLNLIDATDFILDSDLGRKAIECGELPGFATFLRDLISTIHRLTISCHLPEFTDHGLAHLCSLVNRISLWTFAPQGGNPNALLKLIGEAEASILLVATLIHDSGMLSQKPEDLDAEHQEWKTKGQMDIPTWVRKTHVARLERLVRRLFDGISHHETLLKSDRIQQAFRIAKAHDKWPWENAFAELPSREPILAAILAVADLLDEDSNRCDTSTLIRHRHGNMLNIAHWIRHSLTKGQILVVDGTVEVTMVRPLCTDEQIADVFAALRNHYRLLKLYNSYLELIGSDPLKISFLPEIGYPEEITQGLEGWQNIPGIPTQEVLIFYLLNSFYPLGLLDCKRASNKDLQRLKGLEMESIDLEAFHSILGNVETHSPFEQNFLAILNQ